MASKTTETKRPPIFLYDPARDSWQLLSGIGSPVTAPRKGADDIWRATVLSLVPGFSGARVKDTATGNWIGRVTGSGAYVAFVTNPAID
jgi:hypothetical protein